MNLKTMTLTLAIVPLLTLGGPTGCQTAKEHRVLTGAAAGATLGAVAGGVIGHQSGNKGTGAAIGAVTGAALGAGVGYALERRARKFEQVQQVEVETVQPNPTASEPMYQQEHIRLVLNDTVLFDKNSSAVSPGGAAKLNEIAMLLKEQPGERVVIRGYASSDGEDAYNQALSERRATNVANHLVGQGLNPQRITAVGMGESNPIADNSTEAGRAQNRRVEIEVFPPDQGGVVQQY